MKRAIVGVLVIALSFLLKYCDTTEPPPPPNGEKPTLELTLEDMSCIEAWIKLTTTNLQLPATITLKQTNPTGDSLSKDIVFNTQDSLLYIDSLLPNKSYSFIASHSSASGGLSGISSNELSVTTMDTTSHNFTWQMFTFGGEIGSSVLNDVAIINENDIWAVGELWIADTSQLGYTKYNAVHWNGTDWELKQIYFPTVCGSTSLTPYPAKAIFVFGDGEIWISSTGDKLAVLQNGIQTNQFCLPSGVSMSIRSIWGRSGNDLYVVGYAGNIAYFNGTSWSRIESNTTLNMNDIWGDYNQKTGEWEILAVASNILHSYEKEVIKINGENAGLISREGIDWTLSSVWLMPNRKYYVVGSGIYQKHNLSDAVWEDDSLDRITDYHVNKVRANGINDVYVVGAFGEILHFNGVYWKSYLSELGIINGSYLSVQIKDDLVVTVGYETPQAKIMIGRRIQ